MRGSKKSAVAVSLILFAACGPTTGPLVAQIVPPKPPIATVPKPSGARWIIPPVAAGGTFAELATPMGTLLVGESGARFIVAADKKVTNAETLIPEFVRDVTRTADGRYLFLGLSGTSYLSKEPLGPIETRRPGPTLKKGRFIFASSAGKQALIALDDVGGTYRSMDEGVSWKVLPIAWPEGTRALRLGATKRGEVMLAATPQRVMVSVDDGETFTVVPTLGVGVAWISRSRDEKLLFEGAAWLGSQPAQWATLRTDPLRFEASAAPVVTELPGRLATRGERQAHNHVLAGERHVTYRIALEDKAMTTSTGTKYVKKNGTRFVELSIASLGTSVELKRFAELNADDDIFDVAGSGGTVAVAFPVKNADGLFTRVMRTRDDGATWETIEIEGDWNYRYTRGLFVGPNDTLILSDFCASKDGSAVCGNHLYAKGAWRLLPEKKRIVQLLVDAPRNRVLFETRDREIVAATFDFANPKVLATAPTKISTWSVDESGGLWVIDGDKARSFPNDGGDELTYPLPFSDARVSLAGKRGLAMSSKSGEGFETEDGGEHWFKVATMSSGTPRCLPIGCLVGGAARIGWDLPSSTLEAVTEKAPVAPTYDPKAPPGPVKTTLPSLRCKASGKWAKLPTEPRLGAAPVAWTVLRTPHVFFGKGNTVGDAWLFDDPKTTKKKTKAEELAALEGSSRMQRTVHFDAGAGLVLGRFSFEYAPKGSGKRNPVDVEVAWIGFTDAKVHRAKIAAVAPFRIGSTYADANFAVLDDGRLVFLAAGTSPLYLIDPSGKVVTWERPKMFEDSYFGSAWFDGKKLILARPSHDTVLAESVDGKTWTERIWTMGPNTLLERADGKAWLRMASPYTPMPERMYPIGSMPVDPPDAVPTPWPAGSGACTAAQLAGIEILDPEASASMEVTLDNAKKELSSSAAYRRMAPSHPGCIASMTWLAKDKEKDKEHALTHPHDLAHSWLFRGEWGDTEVRPMTCVAAP